jgi:hypothetical protein
LFSFAASKTEGESFSLDIFTHKLGSEPVCTLAEKLQLKMYDFGLPERRGKNSALGYANSRGSRSKPKALPPELATGCLGNSAANSGQKWGDAKADAPAITRAHGFIVAPVCDSTTGHLRCSTNHFQLKTHLQLLVCIHMCTWTPRCTRIQTYTHTHIHTHTQTYGQLLNGIVLNMFLMPQITGYLSCVLLLLWSFHTLVKAKQCLYWSFSFLNPWHLVNGKCSYIYLINRQKSPIFHDFLSCEHPTFLRLSPPILLFTSLTVFLFHPAQSSAEKLPGDFMKGRGTHKLR